jgi:A/G-specific adenine glycosylase
MNNFLQVQKNLLSWYKSDGRHHLVWRKTKDIYHIYLSEIMLQQTQVNRVQSEYYPRFLKQFPTLEKLSKASLDEVLSLWSGLGYYSRARNLHKTAQICKKKLPNSMEELQKLPGIGKYTASAICSFGYHQNVSVVDTNIARVLKRYFAYKDVTDTKIWEAADKFLNSIEPTKHNLALMDLGSMICTPKEPLCEECPLNRYCTGREDPESYTQKKKKEYESLELFYGIYIKDEKIALVKTSGSMYKEMLELPTVDPIEENFLGKFKHSYTKYRLSVNLYKSDIISDEIIWIELKKIDTSPISSLTKKALKKFCNF